MDTRFGTWKVRRLCRTSSLRTAARELGKYRLDLVGVQGSDGRRETLNGQRIIHFSMDRGMGIFS
jgi:hypothetical protein